MDRNFVNYVVLGRPNRLEYNSALREISATAAADFTANRANSVQDGKFYQMAEFLKCRKPFVNGHPLPEPIPCRSRRRNSIFRSPLQDDGSGFVWKGIRASVAAEGGSESWVDRPAGGNGFFACGS